MELAGRRTGSLMRSHVRNSGPLGFSLVFASMRPPHHTTMRLCTSFESVAPQMVPSPYLAFDSGILVAAISDSRLGGGAEIRNISTYGQGVYHRQSPAFERQPRRCDAGGGNHHVARL